MAGWPRSVLARDEMSGPGAENYQKMIETSASGVVAALRAGRWSLVA